VPLIGQVVKKVLDDGVGEFGSGCFLGHLVGVSGGGAFRETSGGLPGSPGTWRDNGV
jgi:hypothetical protein